MKRKKPAPSKIGQLWDLSVGALGKTEAGFRRAIDELRLPKEASNFIVQVIDKRKAEILAIVQAELHRLFQRLDMPRLVRACLAENDIELRIRFHPRNK